MAAQGSATAALLALLGDADRGIERKVNCGSCQACCHNEVVLVDEEPADYEVDLRDGIWFLKHRPDGGCIYLGETGCTIYERRPAICKAFDCGLWFSTTNRPYRRYVKRVGDDHDRQMLVEGRKRAALREGG